MSETGTKENVSAALAAADPAVLQMLAEDLPAQLRDVREYLARADAISAAAVVHTIAGSAAYCRLTRLHSTSLALENALNKKADQTALVEEFCKEVDNVLQMLESTTI